MIAVKLEGRLGNQLFQYAFIFAAAKKLNTDFYLDKSIANFIAVEYFDLKTDFVHPLDKSIFAIKGYKNIFSLHLKKTFYLWVQKRLFGSNIMIINNDQPVSPMLSSLKNNYMYHGYFQSAKYFDLVKQEIRELLSIKKTYVDEFNLLCKTILPRQKNIVVHIRRGDYVDLDWSLPLSYYKNALSVAGYQDSFCIFISDDPLFVEKEFSYIENKYISANHSEIIDMQFLINSDTCILSHSSFSWWGAWLNNNPNKTVYAPEFWLGFESKKSRPAEIGSGVNFNWIAAV